MSRLKNLFSAFLAAGLIASSFPGWRAHAQEMPGEEGSFSAMVVDAADGSILTADGIDRRRDPELLARLITIAMAAEDLGQSRVDPSTTLEAKGWKPMSLMAALQLVALGERGYRIPMTNIAAHVAFNAAGYNQRMASIIETVGLDASEIEVVRGADGGPTFRGHSTLRDTLRLTVALLRGYPDLAVEIFGPAAGNLETTAVWMTDRTSCVLVAKGPLTGKDLAVGITGAPRTSECYEGAARLLAEQDERLSSIE